MEKGTKRRVKKLGTAFFVLYVLVLVYLLSFQKDTEEWRMQKENTVIILFRLWRSGVSGLIEK